MQKTLLFLCVLLVGLYFLLAKLKKDIWPETPTTPSPEKVVKKSTPVVAHSIEEVFLVSLIKQYEDFLPVRTFKNGAWYIGFGHKCFPDEYWEPITEKEAEELIYEDLEYNAEVIRKTLPGLNKNQVLALSSLCFNIGSTRFVNSSLCALIRRKVYIGPYIVKYAKYGDKINEGLYNRRAFELTLFYKKVI